MSADGGVAPRVRSGAGLAPVEPLVEVGDDAVGAVPVHRAEDGVDLLLEPVVLLARLGGAHVQEQGEARDLPDELEKLGLPVLQRAAPDLHEDVG